MDLKLIERPTQQDIDRVFADSQIGENQIIQLDRKDFEKLMSDAENVLMVRGEGRGADRVSEALAQIVERAQADYDIFSANRGLLSMACDIQADMKLKEVFPLSEFMSRYTDIDSFVWGASKRDLGDPEKLSILLVLSDVKISD